MVCHILIVTYPGQGLINPSLQLAKHLLKMGVKVTYTTTISATNRIIKATQTPLDGLTFAPFSDGYDEGHPSHLTMQNYFSQLTVCGSRALADIITSARSGQHQFTHLVYTTLIPWAGQVGHRLDLPCTLLWCQAAVVLAVYYHHCNGFVDFVAECKKKLSSSNSIDLPGLQQLSYADLPSFFLPSSTSYYDFAIPLMKEHVELLEIESGILTNTFDALEMDTIQALQNKIKFIGIGPLIPSAFSDGTDPSDTRFGGDLHFEKSRDYVDWLNKKPKLSVVYAAFGSLANFSAEQLDEIARGLLESGRPFLWVIKAGEGEISCREELNKAGMIVPWCSQVEVLSHPAVGCFVSHCGWNSTLESMVAGVPMVGFPQFSDQGTDAKLVEGVWGTGVKVERNLEGILEGDELKRCLAMVMGDGERGEEMRKNAKTWKELGREAFKEGGSSSINLKAFVDDIKSGSSSFRYVSK